MSSLQVDNIQTYNSNPPVIKNVSGTEVGTFCRAWVNFDGTGTVAIRGSFNVSSITDRGVGAYTINFATAMPDANYAVAGIADETDTINTTVGSHNTAITGSGGATTTECPIYVIGPLGNTSGQALNDAIAVSVAIFR